MRRKLAAATVLVVALSSIAPTAAQAQRRLPDDASIVDRFEDWGAWSWRGVRDVVERVVSIWANDGAQIVPGG